MTNPAVFLPREIMDEIFSYLREPVGESWWLDVPRNDELQRCALVHRAWTPASQALLFQTVILNSFGRNRDPASVPWSPFLSVLEASPHIRPLIRDLCVSNVRYLSFATRLVPGLFPCVARLRLLFTPFYFPLLTCLPALEVLDVDGSSTTGKITIPPDGVPLRELRIGRFAGDETVLEWFTNWGWARKVRVAYLEYPADRVGASASMNTWFMTNVGRAHSRASVRRKSLTKFLMAAQSLEMLSLDLCRDHLYEGVDGSCERQVSWGSLTVLNLRLNLDAHDHLRIVMSLLNDTAFPNLRNLELTLVARHDNRQSPIMTVWGQTVRPLPDHVAAKLEVVVVRFVNFIEIHDSTVLFQLFGSVTDRAGVLRPDWGGATVFW